MIEGRSPLQGKTKEYARVLREHLPELIERYGVESLGLFRSYVQGEEREDSDLDILVEYSRLPDLMTCPTTYRRPSASSRDGLQGS